MKKLVVMLDIYSEKQKKKAMKVVSNISGVDSILIDLKVKKLTMTGDFDPVEVVRQLRKTWHADIVTVGPAKKLRKWINTDESESESEEDAELVKLFQNFNPSMTPHYIMHPAAENPNSCVIS